MSHPENTSSTRVWDPVVRVGHWLLVAGFFTNYIMEDEVMGLHVWIGYSIVAIVLLRVLWGFVGTEHARFGDFVRSPSTVSQYLGNLFRGRARHYRGHNPAGGIMILLLLACMAALAFSGIVLYALEENAGPLAGWVVEAGEDGAQALWSADEHFWEDTHEVLVNLMLGLVIVHVVGVVVTSRLHRENLVRAMITGRKSDG
ncbi:cytochrome b/b6 domain-containing protein [Wenzhouxiangella sp. EGI_FJ10305]|uniref:cytochrome b/b6 domain-containing protein n=1 Tax=Wenzhouxiangella sp. EGI_FJ10305 TaxID=3243768 RepID=UPI0035DF6AB6